jgi:hypothetical protein
MRPLLDPEAEIEPGRGLAGLEIGRHVSEFADVLIAAEIEFDVADIERPQEARTWKSVFSLWEARFRLPQVYETTDAEFDQMLASAEERSRRFDAGEQLEDLWAPETPERGADLVELGVDIRDGLVFALRALEGYEGVLESSLRVGMSGAEALKVSDRLEYDPEGGFSVAGEPGVFLLLGAGPDLDPDEVLEGRISEIWVFDPDRAPSGVLRTSPPTIEGGFDK